MLNFWESYFESLQILERKSINYYECKKYDDYNILQQLDHHN